MKKEKFEKKCQELIEYEEDYFNEIKEFTKLIKEPVNALGGAIAVEKWWYVPSIKKPVENRPVFERGYYCSIDIFFEKSDKESDLNNEGYLAINTVITSYGASVFSKNKFKKHRSIQMLKNEIQEACNEILKYGLKETIEKYVKAHPTR